MKDITVSLQHLAQIDYGNLQDDWKAVSDFIAELQDKLHRRNMQIKELREKIKELEIKLMESLGRSEALQEKLNNR